jgi:hypothetical protein
MDSRKESQFWHYSLLKVISKIIRFQIWVINADLCGCCLISFAMFIASPLLLATGGVGAALGTLGGVALATLLPGTYSSIVSLFFVLELLELKLDCLKFFS